MNWFKRIFCSQDEFNVHANGLPKVSVEIPMPEVNPTKGNDISEPVHVIVKNMLEHPQRWKVVVDTKYLTKGMEKQYSVKDTKTGEVFKASRMYYFGYSDGLTHELDVQVPWMTEDETKLIYDTLGEVYKIKRARLLRLVKYKESQERIRLLEIYK